MPLYVAAGSDLNGLAKWRAGDRMGGPSEMQRAWTLLHENDCYLCEPFGGCRLPRRMRRPGNLRLAWKSCGS